MPSAKSHRSQQRKAEINRTSRSYTRSRITRARAVINSEPQSENAASALKEAISALDRAATKGVMHKNQAARKKSRLQTKFNTAQNS